MYEVADISSHDFYAPKSASCHQRIDYLVAFALQSGCIKCGDYFLCNLRGELKIIKQSQRNRNKNLLAFQSKLASIKIFDPACGSGNFLTESYLSLRRLENDLLKIQLGNDFAVAVAQTAL